jgi:hypothetical protein
MRSAGSSMSSATDSGTFPNSAPHSRLSLLAENPSIESVFSKGARELDELIEGLNGTRVRPPNGGAWTKETFTAVMRELGA